MDIVSNCPLCEEHSLYVLREQSDGLTQCLYCGYVTSDKFINGKDTDVYVELPEEMKKMHKEHDKQVWIPAVMTLPMGIISPVWLDEEDRMLWSFSPLVDIPEEEKENYPDGDGGFYEQKYDKSKTELFGEFHKAMSELNDRFTPEPETEEFKKTELKLPKLRK
jgi:Zn ribbon nucleic-acid-binding protein